MSSAKKGFLFADALICILCVAILSLAVSAAVTVHVRMNDGIAAKIEESDKEFNARLASQTRCGLCMPTDEEDPY